ncbi:MAG: hypothetical protein R8K48_03120 [Gallionella sp.]
MRMITIDTNGSETDIRDFVKKCKVSDGRRSDLLGCQCRDIFASQKKRGRKLDISFGQYLIRLLLNNAIAPLSTHIHNASVSGISP